MNYRQRNVVTFDERAITIKMGATYQLVPNRWDLGANAFYNLLALSSTSPSSYKIQYYGFNLKAGYYLIKAPSSLQFILSGGLYLNGSVGDVGFFEHVRAAALS